MKNNTPVFKKAEVEAAIDTWRAPNGKIEIPNENRNQLIIGNNVYFFQFMKERKDISEKILRALFDWLFYGRKSHFLVTQNVFSEKPEFGTIFYEIKNDEDDSEHFAFVWEAELKEEKNKKI